MCTPVLTDQEGTQQRLDTHLCKLGSLLQAWLAGLKPHQVSVGGISQATGNGRVQATTDLKESLAGAATCRCGQGVARQSRQQQQTRSAFHSVQGMNSLQKALSRVQQEA
jgi:hypothetical protein